MTTLYDGDELNQAISDVSQLLYNKLKDQDPDSIVFVGVLTNGVFFAKRVLKRFLELSYEVKSPVIELDISLYRDDYAKNKNYMSITSSKVPCSVDKKHVILFDDVMATGRTARAALNAIFDYGRPDKVSLAILFDRGNRDVPIEPSVIGKRVDVDFSLRINTQFIEVHGEDAVVLGAF